MANTITKNNARVFFWSTAVIIAVVVVIILLRPRSITPEDTSGPAQNITITNFAECVAAGYPVMESYPPRCATPEGRSFTEDTAIDDVNSLINVAAPASGAVITSPLQIVGEARGTWYFEADFPVELTDANGALLAQGVARAQGDPLLPGGSSEANWMTEDFVQFTTVLTFDSPSTDTGTLIMRKSNPSGLPEQNSELRIPVRFAAAPQNDVTYDGDGMTASDDCVVSGCSSQVCGDEEQMTTCEYRPEYGCYTKATCERQSDGVCGWSMTVELLECLNNTAQ